MEKQYVIQYKNRYWETKWQTAPRRYATMEEAKAVMEEKQLSRDTHRIAEAYTVTRYKPVKV